MNVWRWDESEYGNMTRVWWVWIKGDSYRIRQGLKHEQENRKVWLCFTWQETGYAQNIKNDNSQSEELGRTFTGKGTLHEREKII